MDEALLLAAGEELLAAQRILILSHIRPDGDAVGSLLGLGLSLQAAGKQVQMVLADGLPSHFRHLEGSDLVRTQAEGPFDLSVVLDCSDLNRVGSILSGGTVPDINIDHHPTNLYFAEINLVDPGAVATAEMLAEFLPKFGFPVSQPVASALLYGIVTDTLGFRTSNMTPKAMRIAANLMEAGADLHRLYFHGLLKRSYEAARFWGTGLSGLQREERLIWTELTLEDRQAIGYPGRDDADLINVLTSLDEVDLVVVFIEQPKGRVKVSWRATPDYDVSQIALHFGGGGHRAAAGAEIEGTLDEVKAQVLEATRSLLRNGQPA